MPRPSYMGSGAEVLSFDGSGVMTPSLASSGAAPASAAMDERYDGSDLGTTSSSVSARGGVDMPKKENVMPGSRQHDVQHAWWQDVEGQLALLTPEATLEALLPPCDALWVRLKAPGGPEGPPGVEPASDAETSRRRKQILGAIAGLMDRREPQLLLRLCRLVLGGVPDKGALLGACKLLFKLSKAESNDRRFRELGLLPLLLGVISNGSPVVGASGSNGGGGAAAAEGASSETLLYATGALKNTSADSANQKVLVSLGAVGAFAAALRAQTQRLVRQPAGAAPATPRHGAGGDVAASVSKGVKPAHVLVQLTATLRNVAVSGSSRKQFVSSGCVEELCALIAAAPAHAELALNVSRVLAKLSLHEDVRTRIDSRPLHLDALLQSLKLHQGERQLLIRLCFILGNLSASHDTNREKIATLGLPMLLSLLEQYTSPQALAHLATTTTISARNGDSELPPEGAAPAAALGTFRPPPTMATCGTSTADDAAEPTGASPTAGVDGASSSHDAAAAAAGGASIRGNGGASGGEGGAAAGEGGGADSSAAAAGDTTESAEHVDVLVKLIRLIAHLAISPSIGERIALAPQSLCLLSVLERGRMERHEELLLNATSAVTNLTYYMAEGSVLLRSHTRLCEALVPVLVFPNAEGMIEAARALGNLSRLADARKTICASRVHEALLLLLDHTSSQVAEAACGALINLAADPSTRERLAEAHAAPRLAELLLALLTPRIAGGDRGGGSGGRVPPAQRSDVGAALLAIKTIVNLCCACEVCPLDARLVLAIEQRLREGSGGEESGADEVVQSWRSLGDAQDMMAEWPQATRLLLGLLQRLPAADIRDFNLEEDEEYEESPLEEIPALE